MKSYMIEVFRPPFPIKPQISYRIHAKKDFDIDCTHPCLTTLLEVEGVQTKEEAIAVALEKAAGLPVTLVHTVLGCKRIEDTTSGGNK